MKQNELMRRISAVILFVATAIPSLWADEGMWVIKELNKQNMLRMQELGFTQTQDFLYSDNAPSLSNAVVIFGGGCTGITVSQTGLVFTNHHCGFGGIQKLSSVENDYLKDGFVSQSNKEELPVPGLSVRYLKDMVDVSERIISKIDHIDDEVARLAAADSISTYLVDSVGKSEYQAAQVYPFYNNNKYYLVRYDVFKDVRLVLTPPSSIGKFGGDTDNWMWPRHTGDFAIFRVYANKENKPAKYSKSNTPYKPRFVAEVSMQGYKEGDYAMTIGFPGSTDRYLSSWGVEQRINSTNNPRIDVRGVKQGIWQKAMLADDAVRIKYASKYAGSSNYWKNSIGMNRGLERLDIIDRKKSLESDFAAWVSQSTERQSQFGEALPLLEKGLTESNKTIETLTYLNEAFSGGAEIIRLARMIQGFNTSDTNVNKVEQFLKNSYDSFYKDYEPTLDQEVLAAMLRVVKDKLDPAFLPDVYTTIEKKYKNDYAAYAADLFKETIFTDREGVKKLLLNSKQHAKAMKKDPAALLAKSVMTRLNDLLPTLKKSQSEIAKGERLYFAGLRQMYPADKALPSDANFTMRLSYGSIGGYRPYDAGHYDYYTTHRGILEKENPESHEFFVQEEILDLVRAKDFGDYVNEDGDLQLCFLSNNDITGGNSGSPVFDKNARLIGLAFDGNWEAMSGDIAFEPALQRTISVDMRFVLFMIDKWGKCPRLLEELTIAR